jgi:hypothetical protein
MNNRLSLSDSREPSRQIGGYSSSLLFLSEQTPGAHEVLEETLDSVLCTQ